MSPSRAALRSGLLVLVASSLSTPAAAQWPAGEGGYWAKLSVYHQQTREQFTSDGSRRPFFQPGAESRSSALFLDVLYGVTDRLDVWAQVPYFDLRFDSDVQELHSTGVGDVRVSARYNLFRLRGGSVPISARLTAKIPVLEFPIDADIIPVGEGQWDYEAWIEGGVSFWPVPAYGVVWVGYRWRTLNEKAQIDPGDERVLLGELGGTLVGPVGAKVVFDAIFGEPGTTQGVRVPSAKREIVYLQPALTYEVTPAFTLDAGVRLPLHGRNFPAGPQWVVGLFHRPPGG